MDESIVKHLVPADLDEASRALLRAADYIETHGLAKASDPNYPKNAKCAYLAIGNPDGVERLRNALGGHGIGAIFDWNDAPQRTKEEVVAKLRAVALGG